MFNEQILVFGLEFRPESFRSIPRCLLGNPVLDRVVRVRSVAGALRCFLG